MLPMHYVSRMFRMSTLTFLIFFFMLHTVISGKPIFRYHKAVLRNYAEGVLSCSVGAVLHLPLGCFPYHILRSTPQSTDVDRYLGKNS